MSRAMGHNGATVKALEDAEGKTFAICATLLDLEIAKKAIAQAKRSNDVRRLDVAERMINDSEARLKRAIE